MSSSSNSSQPRGLSIVAPARGTAEEVDGRVVDEMPDAAAHNPVLALVHLGGLDHLLLHGADRTPHAHEAGVLDPVGACHEAGVIRTQGSGEHACAPWPVHLVHFQWGSAAVVRLAVEEKLVDPLDVLACNHGLLLTRVRNLRDWRDGPLVWLLTGLLHAGIVAVAHRVDAWEALVICAPEFVVPSLHGEAHVHEDPATSTRSLLTQRLFGHEVIGSFHTDANVLLIWAVRKSDPLPELGVLGVILGVVELLDADLVHVLGAVAGSLGGQGAQRLGQEVDESELQVWEEVLQLGHPLNADETSAHDED
mmetsp:Transcript_51213/g.92237  ORF Transcript_51213/g.92237 Transcript_51213/m.92237 type:complete len:308 (-) Transcript_51213:580-1503(-)